MALVLDPLSDLLVGEFCLGTVRGPDGTDPAWFPQHNTVYERTENVVCTTRLTQTRKNEIPECVFLEQIVTFCSVEIVLDSFETEPWIASKRLSDEFLDFRSARNEFAVVF